MDPNNPVQNGQNPNPAQPNPALRPMNEPHIPITEDEMNHQMHHESPKSAINTLLTLSSLLVLAGIVGITLWLYIQNRNTPNAQQASNTTPTDQLPANENEPVKEIAGTKVVGEENQRLVEKYGVICKRFTDLDEALASKEIACTIDLSGQSLTEIPTNLYQLTSLNEIDLSNNQLTSIPQALVDMPNLISINMANNNIADIGDIQNKAGTDSEVGDAKPIQLLDLSGNRITEQDQQTLRSIFSNYTSSRYTVPPQIKF